MKLKNIDRNKLKLRAKVTLRAKVCAKVSLRAKRRRPKNLIVLKLRRAKVSHRLKVSLRAKVTPCFSDPFPSEWQPSNNHSKNKCVYYQNM